MIFRDRASAAHALIPLLEKFRSNDCIVFAVPRGGVPVGAIVARHFGFPLEPLLTKKIGYPGNPELAIGAVSLDSYVLDPHFQLPEAYVEAEIRRIRDVLAGRYRQFMGDHRPADPAGKTVILVDDGIATGNTLLAAVKMMRHKHPSRIVVAVPVAPPSSASTIRNAVDEFICLDTPEDFFGVGQFYEDFSQVTDEEAVQLLKETNALHGGGGKAN
jgi:putative phosphoribosyl transferase